MLETSAEYKTEQKQALREKSYVFVDIGIINLEAKEKAVINGTFTDYSYLEAVLRGSNKDSVGQYATLEQDFTRVDNANAFLPRNSYIYSKNQGLITTNFVDDIHITFGSLVDVDIKGLTIDFGDCYPTQFVITNGNVSYTYTKEDSSLFICEDQFDNSTYLDIIPSSMVGGQQRFRILSIEFGVGLSFTNNEIMSTQRRNTVSHISEALPLKAFDFTINNLSRKFSQDNPLSFAHYIEEGQPVQYRYGRDVVDGEGNTTMEIIEGGKTYVKTWSSNDLSAKFSTVGRLDMMDNEYYRGTYDDNTLNPRTAYDVAEAIFADAGISSDEYVIDDYLNVVVMHNPVPITTHKAALQMVANASKAILFEDRSGRICLRSSVEPTIGEEDIETFYGALVFVDAFRRNRTTYDWATLEDGFTRVDNTMYFRARNNPTKNPGILSDIGTLRFIVNFDIAWHPAYIHIVFSEITPATLLISFSKNGVDVASYISFNVKQEIWIRNNTAIDFDKVECMAVSRATTYGLVDENGNILADEDGDTFYADVGNTQRIHIKKFLFTNETGFGLTNTDLAQKPVATSIEKVKQLEVNHYNYSYGEENKQLTSVEVNYDGTPTKNIIKLSNPADRFTLLWEENNLQEWSESTTYTNNQTVKYKGIKYQCIVASSTKQRPDITPSSWSALTPSGVSITDYGNYFVEVTVTASPTAKLQVYGYPMNVAYQTLVTPLHDIGNAKRLNNVLIENESQAVDVSEWVEEYLEEDTEYTIQYRGEPAIDCDDLIYLQSQFVRNNLCRVVEEEINTAVGMSLTNNMKLRRVSYTT